MPHRILALTKQVIFTATLIVAAIFPLPNSAHAAPPDDPAEFEAFLDGFLASAMEQYHVPGLVFVMVKNGQVFFSKGYGYADIEKNMPVDPEKTLFRVASVSKLFTATAIMQLVEQGKLDMHKDVNVYLKTFKVPPTFPEPVTTHHLLTHSAGYNERVFGMAVRNKEDVFPLDEYLAKRMPRRAVPPGEIFSYSNHGFALAGHLVECVSGMEFNAYVTENIYAPLGMDRSSFYLTPDLRADLAQGYFYQNYEYQLAPYDYSNDAPAGSMITSGNQIARFMLAHLQGGRLGDARILSEETARYMQAQHFTHHPKLPGAAYNFMEDIINGRRIIGHGGNWRGFTSRLVLDPEANLGFFLSYNALSSAGTENGLREDFLDVFYDRYFPVPEVTLPKPNSNVADRAKLFVGSYRHSRYMRDSFGKLATLLSEWKVTAHSDGSLKLCAGFLREPIRLAEVEPLLFLRSDGKGYAAFRSDSNGRITYLFIENYAAEKLSTIESADVQILLLLMIILIFLTAIIGWPVAFLLRKPRPSHPAGARAARWLTAMTALLFIYFLVAIAAELTGEVYDYSYGVPAKTAFLLKLSYFGAALVIGMVACTAISWRKGWWTIVARIHYCVITLAAVALIPILIYWRLLGYGY